MDIVRKKAKATFAYKKIVGVAALICGLVWGAAYASKYSSLVSASSVLLAQVEQGKLSIDVRGVGTLVPKQVNWVATEVSGRVEQVLIKAGAEVKQGDVIVTLENPELVQTLESSRWELQEVTAQLNAQRVSLESSVLDQETLVSNSKLNYEGALLTLNAQKTLLDQGVYTISTLEHEKVKIEVKQFHQRWLLEQKRFVKAQENLAAQKLAFAARLQRLERQINMQERLVDKLTVRASIDSVVQEMPLEIGQQIGVGTNVAKLAKNDEFIAEIRVPEKQIYQVALTQPVTIDTKTTKVAGKVTRIDPAVVNGTVQVDITLVGDLPKEARPELTVDGIIHVASLDQSVFVKRPMFAKANSDSSVYVVNSATNEVSLAPVKFGRSSQTHIEITSGLRPGQHIVISDVSSWKDDQITAIQ